MPGASPLLQRDKGQSWRHLGNPHLMEGFSLPATPSKAKPGRKGFCSFTTLLVLFALLAGVVMFSQDLSSSSRTETYYRKALVAKMYFGNNGQTVTATSEEYSRSTVAGGAKKSTSAARGEGSHGEQRSALELDEEDEAGGVAAAGIGATADDGTDNDVDDDAFIPLNDKEDDDKEQVLERSLQPQQPQLVTTAKIAANTSGPVTVTIHATEEDPDASSSTEADSDPTAATELDAEEGAGKEQPVASASAATTVAQPLVAQSAAAAADQVPTAAVGAAGQASQQQQQAAAGETMQQGEAGASGAKQEADASEAAAAWWSDLVSPSGERLPKAAKRERDISASLATAVVFDESAVPDDPDCQLSVLDVDQRWGESFGAGNCDLSDEKLWPFARPGRGIDGHHMLPPEQYQYSMEYWIAQAIRKSRRYTPDTSSADFVFVDMHCYHSSWMAWLHPQNEEGREMVPSPEYYIKRSIAKLRGMTRFRQTKGGDFSLVHPAPMMRGLFSEEAACEDLASVLNMVPERSSLCVWTQDSHTQGKSVLLPYAAVSDIDMDGPVVPAADRETFIFFQGGCGDPNPVVRPLFAAGKMLRYALVQELKALNQADIHAECSCDICEAHMPHDQLMARMSRSVFCPIMPSNTQSSRRLSEAMLTGCIPVFVGEPFHTLPLASDVDYKSFALFVNVSDSSPWVNTSSPKWEHNHMISKAWKLDDRSVESGMLTVPRLADLVTLLRGLPAEEVAARHAAVVANRLKFWYPPASAQAIATSVAAAGAASAAGAGIATSGAVLRGGGSRGGNGRRGAGARALSNVASAAEALQEQLAAAKPGQSVLGELLMRKMCRRAAAVRKRLAEAARQGLDIQDSDEKVEHPSLVAQQAASDLEDIEEEGGEREEQEQVDTRRRRSSSTADGGGDGERASDKPGPGRKRATAKRQLLSWA